MLGLASDFYFLFIFVYLGFVRILLAGQHQPLGLPQSNLPQQKVYVCMYVGKKLTSEFHIYIYFSELFSIDLHKFLLGLNK